MKLKNILIVVKDIERSRQFYHDLFGLDRIVDNDGNMILMDGLVLQDEKIWREFLGKRSSRETMPVNCILKRMIWRRLLKNWNDCIRRCSMSTGSRRTAGGRRWFAFMIWMEI